jgi:hypothetical protein
MRLQINDISDSTNNSTLVVGAGNIFLNTKMTTIDGGGFSATASNLGNNSYIQITPLLTSIAAENDTISTSSSLSCYSNGNVGVLASMFTIDASTLRIVSSGDFQQAPQAPESSGTPGEIRVTADSIYVCTATATWKRSPLLPFSITSTELNQLDGNVFTSDIKLNTATIGLGGGHLGTNVAFGIDTLTANSTGQFCVAIGKSALAANTEGYSNVVIGSISAGKNTTGTGNIVVGNDSFKENISSSYNTTLGYGASYYHTTGDFNIAIGRSAGSYYRIGSTNYSLLSSTSSIFIGEGAAASADGNTNEIVIGMNTIGNGSNTVTIGHTTITKTVLRGAVEAPNLKITGTASTDVNTLDVYEEGSFTITLNGCTTSPTRTAKYVRVGKMVVLSIVGNLSAESASTTCTLSGLPAIIATTDSAISLARIYNGGAVGTHLIYISGNVIYLTVNDIESGFSPTGTKGTVSNLTLSYMVG